MAGKNYPEAHKMILLVQKAPFVDEEKTRLVDLLTANGLTDETVDEVQKAFSEIPKERFTDDWQHAKLNLDLRNLMKQWQLSYGSKNFKHNR